ncbi:MAG: lipid II:glycine glycyltransferase FemX [Spirochaetota bacterium]
MTGLHVVSISLEQLSQPNNPMQTPFWARVKQYNGWIPVPLEVSVDSKKVQMLLLKKQVAPGFTLAYVPFGPESDPSMEFLTAVSQALSREVCSECFAIRWEPPWSVEASSSPDQNNRLIRRRSIQPDTTVVIGLETDCDTIFSNMRKRARRAVRNSLRVVEVAPWNSTSEEFDTWYELYLETAARDRFQPRSRDYLLHLLRQTGKAEPLLLLARQNGVLTGGIIVVYTSRQALYLIGASSREAGEISSSYALQWKAICMAQERGCSVYDLHGIAPPKAEAHHLAGLNLFKTGFGGSIVQRIGCFEYRIKPVRSCLFSQAEKVRSRNVRGL